MESDGRQLIDELIADPHAFDEEGRAYQLLQCYFAGFPLDTLRPLLRSEDRLVQRAAAFVVSELGVEARALLDDMVHLMRAGDRYLKYQAMEALTVCADGERSEAFAYVALELEGDDEVLRLLAMRLMANADTAQLAAAGRFIDSECGRQRHSRALTVLADESTLGPAEAIRMIGDPDPLLRRYGAVAAKRLRHRYPEIVSDASSATEDPELLKYFSEA